MNTKDPNTPKELGGHFFPHSVDIPLEMQPAFSESEVDGALTSLSRASGRAHRDIDLAPAEDRKALPVKRSGPSRSTIEDAFSQELERYIRKEGIYSPALDQVVGKEPSVQDRWNPLRRFIQICGSWGLLEPVPQAPRAVREEASGLPYFSGDPAEECARFEELLQKEAPLTDFEIDEILAYEDTCAADTIEKELGLPSDAFVQGFSEHGLLSAAERLKRLRSYIKIVIQEEESDAVPEDDQDEIETERRTGHPAQAFRLNDGNVHYFRSPIGFGLEQPSATAMHLKQSPLAFAPLTHSEVTAPPPFKVLTGCDLAGLSPIRGLFRQEGSVTWLNGGMFRLDQGFAEEDGSLPTCTTFLWRLFPHCDTFISLPAEEMVLFVLEGEIDWEDACSGKTIRLGARESKNFLWTSSGTLGSSRQRQSLLPPFRARQVGNQEAVAVAVVYSSSGLRFDTARDGRQIQFRTREWDEDHIRRERPWLARALGATASLQPFTDRIPWDLFELEALLSNAQSLRGDRHDPARRAGQFQDRDLPGWSRLKGVDANLQVRIAKFHSPLSRPRRGLLLTEHAGLELILPLFGKVEFFGVLPEQIRGSRLERSVWSLKDFEPDQCVWATASSAEASKTKFPDLLLLRSRYPHALQGVSSQDSMCIHIRCLSQR